MFLVSVTGAVAVDTAPPNSPPIAASTIPQFVDPLPILDVTGASNGTIQTIVAGKGQIPVEMQEFKAKMLPTGFNPNPGGSYDGTWVWGYVKEGTDTSKTRDTFTGPVVVATRGIPTEMKFTNNLGSTDATSVLAYNYAIDQSIHWANPNNDVKYVRATAADPWVGNPDHYIGPIPAAVHLHGAEDPAAIDGGPESWFLSDGSKVGKAFYSMGWDGVTPQNYVIYRYPNVQEASPLWFHDHTLGATRLNVYMGLAGVYALIDPKLKLPTGLNALGLRNGPFGSNPVDDTLIPLVVQDRMFDLNGQLYFPAGPEDLANPGPNPEHAYWVPEFFGEAPNVSDTVVVNGKTWPYLNVKAQRYRFYMIGGSNARTWELSFKNSFDDTSSVPAIWQIATDQGYLDTPVKIDPLVVMPGERAEFIIDFGSLPVGTELVLNNLGPDEPFDGVVGSQDQSAPATTGRIMKFKVVSGAASKDTSFNPAAPGAKIRKSGQTIVRLVDPVAGTLAKKVNPDLTRALTLVEIAYEDERTVGNVTYSGGPLEVLVNNTKWMGRRPNESDPNQMMGLAPVNGGVSDGIGNYLTELPNEGATEVWEIVCE